MNYLEGDKCDVVVEEWFEKFWSDEFVLGIYFFRVWSAGAIVVEGYQVESELLCDAGKDEAVGWKVRCVDDDGFASWSSFDGGDAELPASNRR